MALRYQILLFFLMLFSGLAFAGTVSITGTCQSNLLPGNVLNFTIINTGNDTAYGLTLSPSISGASLLNNTYAISSLPPNIKVPILIPLVNIGVQGTYVDSFMLTYQQGTSTFTALFPCLINLGKATTSGIYLSVNASSSSGRGALNVSIFNGVRENFSVNVTALFPPSFVFSTSKSYTVNLGPYQTKNVFFDFTYPSGQASYAGAVAGSYISANATYSSFAPIIISGSSHASANPVNLVFVGGGLVVLLIILLILRSILVKRPKSNSVQ